MTANMFYMAKVVNRAYKYRFYPARSRRRTCPGPSAASARSTTSRSKRARRRGASGRNERKVYNLALEARTAAWCQRQERVTYLQSSALLTRWKRSDDLAFLAEVSSVPLQQALRHLQSAFARFWDG